jgi:hypothetical protein
MSIHLTFIQCNLINMKKILLLSSLWFILTSLVLHCERPQVAYNVKNQFQSKVEFLKEGFLPGDKIVIGVDTFTVVSKVR